MNTYLHLTAGEVESRDTVSLGLVGQPVTNLVSSRCHEWPCLRNEGGRLVRWLSEQERLLGMHVNLSEDLEQPQKSWAWP